MDTVLAEPLRPGSLRLGLRVSFPDDPRIIDIAPALSEGADYDVAWIERMFDPTALSTQQLGRANRLIHAASSMAEVRKALEESLRETHDDQALFWFVGHGKFDPAAAPDRTSEGYVLRLKSPWDVLNAELADASGSDGPAVRTAVEAGTRWQALLPYASRTFVEAAQTPGVALQPTVAGSREFLHTSMNEFVAGFMVTVRSDRLIQSYLEGLRRLVHGVADVLRLVLIVVLAALSQRPQSPIFLLVMLASIRHYGHRSEPDGHFRPARAAHLCTSRGVACPVT